MKSLKTKTKVFETRIPYQDAEKTESAQLTFWRRVLRLQAAIEEDGKTRKLPLERPARQDEQRNGRSKEKHWKKGFNENPVSAIHRFRKLWSVTFKTAYSGQESVIEKNPHRRRFNLLISWNPECRVWQRAEEEPIEKGAWTIIARWRKWQESIRSSKKKGMQEKDNLKRKIKKADGKEAGKSESTMTEEKKKRCIQGSNPIRIKTARF